MNTRRLLKLLVVADVLLAFGSVGAQALFGWTLPPALQEFTRARFSRMPDLGDAIPLILLLTTSACAFVAWVGLVTFWRHARGFYLFSLATWLMHMLATGPAVNNSVSAVFTTMNAVVAGVIIGLVYFSDLARRFEKGAAERATSASTTRAVSPLRLPTRRRGRTAPMSRR